MLRPPASHRRRSAQLEVLAAELHELPQLLGDWAILPASAQRAWREEWAALLASLRDLGDAAAAGS